MKPARVEYARAESADHAVQLLHEIGDEARILAGGQSLIPMMNFRLAAPRYLVDISRTPDLAGLALDDDATTIRAAVPYCDVLRQDVDPVLSGTVRMIGHEQIRNLGTVVGSLAHNDPSAELPAFALVTGAVLMLRSQTSHREVAAEEFFGGGFAYMTDAQPDELIESVKFPTAGPGVGRALTEHARRPGDFATAGVACQVRIAERSVSECRVATFGGPPALRFHADASRIAVGESPSDDLWDDIAAAIAQEITVDDPARDAYLQRLTHRLVVDALGQAVSNSGATQ